MPVFVPPIGQTGKHSVPNISFWTSLPGQSISNSCLSFFFLVDLKRYKHQIITSLPLFQNGATTGFELCFAASTSGAGSKRSQPKHVSNLDPVKRGLTLNVVYGGFSRPCPRWGDVCGQQGEGQQRCKVAECQHELRQLRQLVTRVTRTSKFATAATATTWTTRTRTDFYHTLPHHQPRPHATTCP